MAMTRGCETRHFNLGLVMAIIGLALVSPAPAFASKPELETSGDAIALLLGKPAAPPPILERSSLVPGEATEAFKLSGPSGRLGVAWRPNGLILDTVQGVEIVLAEPAPATGVREEDGSRSYSQLYPGVALRYRPRERGMGIELWIGELPWRREIVPGDTLIVSWRMDLEGVGQVMQTEDKNPWVVVLDQQGRIAFFLSRPLLRPAGGPLAEAPSLDIDYQAGKLDDSFELVVSIRGETLERLLGEPETLLDFVAFAAEPEAPAAP